jgi:ribosomal protein S18 acetylase RimI-like enzyme
MHVNPSVPDSGTSIQVRAFAPADRQSVLDLAPRLTVGMAPWRDSAASLAAARGWVESSLARIGPDQAVFVATDAENRCLGFISVGRSRHFSGEAQAYIGELVVATEAEGRGVGRLLVVQAETWAREQGFRTVALETGSANLRARGFYDRLQYVEEGVTLIKVLPKR